jgi:hypothetical protein
MIMTDDDRALLRIDPGWLAELRRRCEAAGVTAVAKRARMSRTTLWAALTDRKPRPAEANQARASYKAVERARRALTALTPDDAPMPPPFLAVGGPRTMTWQIATGKRSAKRG